MNIRKWLIGRADRRSSFWAKGTSVPHVRVCVLASSRIASLKSLIAFSVSSFRVQAGSSIVKCRRSLGVTLMSLVKVPKRSYQDLHWLRSTSSPYIAIFESDQADDLAKSLMLYQSHS